MYVPTVPNIYMVAMLQKLTLRPTSNKGRVQLKCDGTRLRTGGEVKGKQENGVGNK
jgi:hypothetical protein